MFQAFKYRIYPNKIQIELLNKSFGCSRFIYNWGLEAKTKSYAETGKGVSRFELDKSIKQLKLENEWLKEVPSQIIQQSLVDLDKAFTNFFRKTTEYPVFKRKGKKDACRFPQGVKVNFELKTISLPKLGKIHCHFSREFEGVIKSATVSKTPTGKFYISILVDNKISTPKKLPLDVNKSIGVDVGIKHFATLSNGTKIDNPKFGKKYEQTLKAANKEHSRKTKGSKNKEKARKKLALIHEKIANCRLDFLHKTTTKLIRENQSAIVIEDLNVKGMMKSHKLAKSIADVSWGMFFSFLEYKAERIGKHIIKINRFQPSSKICSCGVINKELKLSDREWTCKACNVTHDRDLLASKNILKFGFLENKTRRDTA